MLLSMMHKSVGSAALPAPSLCLCRGLLKATAKAMPAALRLSWHQPDVSSRVSFVFQMCSARLLSGSSLTLLELCGVIL